MREERAGPELPLVAGEVEDRDAGELGREEVRRALDPAEDTADGTGEGLGEQGLADAGHVLDEQVAAGEQRDERQLDRLRLAPQDLLHLVADDPGEAGGRLEARVATGVGGGGERSGGRLHAKVFGPGCARPKPRMRKFTIPALLPISDRAPVLGTLKHLQRAPACREPYDGRPDHPGT